MRMFAILSLSFFPLLVLAQPSPIVQTSRVVPAPPTLQKPRDLAKIPDGAQPIYFCAERATDWLRLANRADGRFKYGLQPALKTNLDGDNYLSQVGAGFALARAGRYFCDERITAVARQSLLTLLLETMPDPDDKSCRCSAAPPLAISRLHANGTLVLAIHELANPGTDLLDKADELCNYIRKQQRPDGSLLVTIGPNLVRGHSPDGEAENAGWAMHGLIRSCKRRPADWKLDIVRKARGYYHDSWQTNRSIACVASQTPAYAEAYLLTKEKEFADTVFAMNDWLVGLQYRDEFESTRAHWAGGFPRSQNNKVESTTPDISSARAAVSLAEACRVAKHAGDLPRLQRYERALLNNVQFLMKLQYTSYNTDHFTPTFRPNIIGAFFASHQDGNIRIDYTQHALTAMVQYLDAVIE